MDEKTVKYEGKTYTFTKSGWVNSQNSIDPGVQQELYRSYYLSLRVDDMSERELEEHIDFFMNTGRFDYAEKLCRKLIPRADSERLEFIYPRLTSCLRKLGRPGDAVKIYLDIQKKYGAFSKILSHALLTSVGAAYCDINNWRRGEECAKQAWKKAGKTKTLELKELYIRIDKHFGRR